MLSKFTEKSLAAEGEGVILESKDKESDLCHAALSPHIEVALVPYYNLSTTMPAMCHH